MKKLLSSSISILIVISILFCTLTLIYAGYIFCSQIKCFSDKYAEVIENIQQYDENEKISRKELVDEQMEHLTTLQELQENSMSMDLLVFLYGLLCSIFVGIGTYYVKNIKDGSKEADKLYKEAKNLCQQTKKYCLESDNLSKNILYKCRSIEKASKETLKSCNQKKEQISTLCDNITNAQSYLFLQNANQTANFVLTLCYKCEGLDQENDTELEILQVLMPKVNDGLYLINDAINRLDMNKILKKDLEMLDLTLKAIKRSVVSCGAINDVFFSKEYVEKVDKEIQEYINKIGTTIELEPNKYIKGIKRKRDFCV